MANPENPAEQTDEEETILEEESDFDTLVSINLNTIKHILEYFKLTYNLSLNQEKKISKVLLDTRLLLNSLILYMDQYENLCKNYLDKTDIEEFKNYFDDDFEYKEVAVESLENILKLVNEFMNANF